ncbi:MAG: hypothetical protein CMH46_10695 [Muricauda sp.]|nr:MULTISPECIES: hypothetical protein [unclassified Allomuricauda]MAU15991.1 hypothetical protein [Allomuricauda sp.]|tara:strand:+ start:8134 stop:8679 length:546 start_codon:yes stop_codon:yes gene_type:complete
MKRTIIFCAIAFLACTIDVDAQNCNQGKKLAEKTWEKWGPWKPNITLIPFKNEVKKIKGYWNWIANNGGATIGPRFLEVDGGNENGNIAGQTKRTFVTPPSFNNTMTITINKYGGRAETGVVICSHGRNGVTRQLKSYTFPNSRNGSVKKFTLSGVKGKIISVAMKNRSIGNKFKYKINAK